MMKIAGLMKASLIDYPGKASAVVFFGGCNFRCGYCHNPEIVEGGHGQIDAEDFFEFLLKRKRFLDAVCVSGGEPTLQTELIPFLTRIKSMGLAVKLDTNGSRPEVLKELLSLQLLDYVAMDFKAPYDRYQEIAGSEAEAAAAAESRQVILCSDIDFEFRTTVCRELLALPDLVTMSDELGDAVIEEMRRRGGSEQRDQNIGGKAGHPFKIKWYLQQFQKQGTILNESGNYSAYSQGEMESMAEAVLQHLQDVGGSGEDMTGCSMEQGKELVCVSVR